VAPCSLHLCEQTLAVLFQSPGGATRSTRVQSHPQTLLDGVASPQTLQFLATCNGATEVSNKHHIYTFPFEAENTRMSISSYNGNLSNLINSYIVLKTIWILLLLNVNTQEIFVMQNTIFHASFLAFCMQ